MAEKEKKRRRKQEKNEKEKDPNQKEYSLFSNMFYVMKGCFSFQKSLIVFLIVVVLTGVAATYLPTFALSAAVDQITKQVEFGVFLRTVLLFYGAILVIKVIQSWCESNVWWREIDARVQFMMLRIHKVLYMDYEYLESANKTQQQP